MFGPFFKALFPAGFANPNAWQWGDFTADGVVDARDLNQLEQNRQLSIPTVASPAVVPEPASTTLALLALAVATFLRRRATAHSLAS
jgi:MYXO-CTERM domain-containing protein